MNAEVFAKGLEKCRLLTRLLGQNAENLDDYGCPEVQDLVKTKETIKRHHVVKFRDEVRLLSLKRTTWKQRRNVLSSEKRLQPIAVITPPVINHLS